MAKRTSYGSTWWGQRWIAALERFGWASRLQRGRSYARAGHVKQLAVEAGKIAARVAGSRPQPYRVSITVEPLSASEWERVITALAGRAAFAASLLAGEMPKDIEEAFAGVKVPLFPRTAEELTMSCSCPDWANPCKHLAAVYYRLGEEFDRDPFMLLHLRGRDRESLLAAIRQKRAVRAGDAVSGGSDGVGSAGSAAALLAAGLERFWEPAAGTLAIPFQIEPPAMTNALLRRLGPLQGVDGGKETMERLEQYYEIIGKEAMALAVGEGPEADD